MQYAGGARIAAASFETTKGGTYHVISSFQELPGQVETEPSCTARDHHLCITPRKPLVTICGWSRIRTFGFTLRPGGGSSTDVQGHILSHAPLAGRILPVKPRKTEEICLPPCPEGWRE